MHPLSGDAARAIALFLKPVRHADKQDPVSTDGERAYSAEVMRVARISHPPRRKQTVASPWRVAPECEGFRPF